MRTSAYQDPLAFQQRVLPMLMRHEWENNLMIGMISRLVAGESIPGAPPLPLLFLVEDSNCAPALAATLAGPLAMVLCRAPTDAVHELARHVTEQQAQLPGVSGPDEVAAIFASEWSARTSRPFTHGHHMRLFRAEKVIPPRPAPGGLRSATPNDVPLLNRWAEDFNAELKLPLTGAADVEKRVGEGRMFLWCDRSPVAMAGTAVPTPRGVRVSLVYTPPEFRRRGYASACVAALTSRLLDSGLSALLYCDADNPVTPAMYQKIGYEHVCDWKDFFFGENERHG